MAAAPMLESHFIASAGAAPGYFTPTLTSLLGEMLELAEWMYGARDRGWTILGIEFGPKNPNMRLARLGRRDVIVQLSGAAMGSHSVATWRLAHECVHLLSPNWDVPTLVIEEGAADFFQAVWMKHTGITTPRSAEQDAVNNAYAKALMAVAELAQIEKHAIRKLRSVEPCFSLMKPATFTDAGIDVPQELRERLLAPFSRSA